MVFRKHGMQHDLFVMFYTACLWSVFAINTCDSTYINTLCVFYIVQRWVGLGAGVKCSNESKNVYQIIYIFLQMHANHQIKPNN